MKYFYSSLLAILIFLLVPKNDIAQQLAKMHVVGKGKYLPSQLIDKSIKDANGQECAGLVIISDLDGLKYDSYNGIVKRNHKPGQDFLFLSSDERVVTVYKSGYVPLKIILSEYGIHLKKGEVWQLEITGDKKKNLIPINILTNPKGAKIFIDSTRIDTGLTDSLKSYQVSTGKHLLKIIKNGYYTISKVIHVNPNNTLFSFSLKEKEVVPVEIKSKPKGATIYINNNNVGKTNYGFFRYPGKYTIRLSKAGYLDTTAHIIVKSHGTNLFVFHLNKNYGQILLNVKPQDASITINSKNYSGKTKLTLLPGPYKIVISKKGFYSQTGIINVIHNKTITKTYSLRRKTGSLRFSIQPIDANVELLRHGKVVRSWRGLKIINDLPVGTYSLIAQMHGYEQVKDTVHIKEGRTSAKDLILESSLVKKALTEQNKLSKSYKHNLSDKGVKPKNPFKSFHSFVSITMGVGNSFGNKGIELGYRIGAVDFHVGVGSHVYTKEQNYSNHELVAGGMRFILTKGFSKSGNFGAEFYLDLQYGSLAIPVKAYGPSALLGGTLWFGKAIGLTTSWGISYNLIPQRPQDKYMMAGDLIGLALKL